MPAASRRPRTAPVRHREPRGEPRASGHAVCVVEPLDGKVVIVGMWRCVRLQCVYRDRSRRDSPMRCLLVDSKNQLASPRGAASAAKASAPRFSFGFSGTRKKIEKAVHPLPLKEGWL